MYYNAVDDYARAPDKVGYIRGKSIEDFNFTGVTPDTHANWLDQSDSGFDQLLSLANRGTKLAKSPAAENAVFGLYSLGVITAPR